MPKATTGWSLAPAVAAAIALGGCASNAAETLTPGGQRAPGSTVTLTSPVPGSKPQTVASQVTTALPTAPASFDAWRNDFRVRALSAGISAATFDAAFRNVRVNQKVVELDTRQPEFSRPIWQYLDGAVSDSRVATARGKIDSKGSLLRGIEQRYNVDYPIVVAIWGLESGFGSNFGNIPVIQSMATLAYEGRRRDFAEQQLIAALRILQAGDITPARMVGSWAGAMGHTQFIPTSFLDYAVDYTGDGRRDIWAADAADALASTANYLARFGWTRGAPAVVEVRLPQNFDYAAADDKVRLTAAEWSASGVRGVGGALPQGQGVSILLPAGARGPAFAVYPNFRVIKRYNNATSYALAVAHLAERMTGAPPFQAAWPREDRTLSRTEKMELQTRLTVLGFDTQGADGIIGPNSRAAVRQFQQARGMVPDGYVSAKLLQAVRAAGG